MWSNRCEVKDDNHFPRSTSNSPFHTTQDAVGFLCCQGTLLAHDHDLWAWPHNQLFFPQLVVSLSFCPSTHPSIQPITAWLGYKDIVRNSMKNLANVEVTSSTLSLCTNGDCFLTEDYQAGDWSTDLGKSMLTVSSHLILPHVPRICSKKTQTLIFKGIERRLTGL